jgi:hypothetical protein
VDAKFAESAVKEWESSLLFYFAILDLRVDLRVLFLASEYVSKQVRVVPSINRPTRVNPSVFKKPW